MKKKDFKEYRLLTPEKIYKRKHFFYKAGAKVLVKNFNRMMKLDPIYIGSFTMVKTFSNRLKIRDTDQYMVIHNFEL